MEPTIEMQDTRQEIKKKLRKHFDGKIVRKDLTKRIRKKGPMCLSMSWSSSWASIARPMMTPSLSPVYRQVKRILADNFVRPDESQKILSQLRKRGS